MQKKDKMTSDEYARIIRLLMETINETEGKGFKIPNIRLDPIKVVNEKSNYATVRGIKKFKIELSQILIELEDEHVKAILAHEIGHAINFHELKRAIAIIVWLLTIALIPAYSLVMVVITKNPIYWFLLTIVLVSTIIQFYISENNEYKADAFAKLLGYDNELAEALSKAVEFKSSIVVNLLQRHPKTSKRIERLKK